MIPEGAVEDPLGRGTGEDAREGLGYKGRESSEGGPGLDAQPSERIQSDC